MFFCSECGNEYKKWQGRCFSCKEFNTLVEVKDDDFIMKNNKSPKENTEVHKLNLVRNLTATRKNIGLIEFDKVLGGGVVEGSLILLGGSPGVGKSTLIMQVCSNLSIENKLLYVSGEESEEQIKLRASRIINDISDNFLIANLKNIENIERVAIKEKVEVLIIDSIQTMYVEGNSGVSGSIGQLKESTLRLMNFAKKNNIIIFMIGHITKGGEIAGPKLLEHMVDVVLYLDSEIDTNYRILRAKKNRFGKIDNIGILEMTNSGMISVIDAADALLYKGSNTGLSHGILKNMNRSFIVEVQSLVVTTNFGYPKRTTQGYDIQRLNLLLGLLQKRLKLDFSNVDCYLNISIILSNRSNILDLAVIASLISSLLNRTIDNSDIYLGEVKLTGEIKKANDLVNEFSYFEKLGAKNVYCNLSEDVEYNGNLNIISIKNIEDLNKTLVK